MAGLQTGSEMNMDLLNMGMTAMAPGNSAALFPQDGAQASQDNSTTIKI